MYVILEFYTGWKLFVLELVKEKLNIEKDECIDFVFYIYKLSVNYKFLVFSDWNIIWYDGWNYYFGNYRYDLILCSIFICVVFIIWFINVFKY